MLLHIYVQKIHFETPPSNAMAAFLSIHSGSFEYCISSVYYKGGTAFFDQVVHVPIQNDNDPVTKVTLLASIFMKNGLFEPQGKCSFITSPLEHGTTKHFSMFGKEGAILSQVELTPSFYAAPMSDGVWKGKGGPEEIISDDFRKEYEFLMRRKRNWGGDRPSTFKGEHEALLADNRDYDEDAARHGVAARKEQNRYEKNGARKAPHPSWEAPKLRKTCMAVGFVNFWPAQQDAQCDEDKILLKLHLAEQRRLKILRDSEEKTRAKNELDRRTSRAALHKKPTADVMKLKKILLEKEKELQLLRESAASHAAVHKDFNSYHHTHSAVTSNVPTIIMGRKSSVKSTHAQNVMTTARTSCVSKEKKTIKKTIASKGSKVSGKKKPGKAVGSKVSSETVSKKKKNSRIKARRDEQNKAATGMDRSSGSMLIKNILSRSAVLQQRLNESWNSNSANDDIHIKLQKLAADSTASTVDSDASDLSAGLGEVNESMSELRQSFREALDLTARKNKKNSNEQDAKVYTRTVFIPTSTSARMEFPRHDASALHDISGIDVAKDTLYIPESPDKALRNAQQTIKNEKKSIGIAHSTHPMHPPTVASASTDGQYASIYEDLIMAMGSEGSSDTESIDLVGYSEQLRGSMKNSGSGKQKTSHSVGKSSSGSVDARKSVVHASTASSRQKAKSLRSPSEIKKGKKATKLADTSFSGKKSKQFNTNFNTNITGGASRSSYLQLLSSNSKDVSEEARCRYLLYGADDIGDGFDYDSTLLQLLARTPLAAGISEASQCSEDDFGRMPPEYSADAVRPQRVDEATMTEEEALNFDVGNEVGSNACEKSFPLDANIESPIEGGPETIPPADDSSEVRRLNEPDGVTKDQSEAAGQVDLGSAGVVRPAEEIEQAEVQREEPNADSKDSAANQASWVSQPGYATIDYHSQITNVSTTVDELEEKISFYMKGSSAVTTTNQE